MATVYSRIANPYQKGSAGTLNAPTPFYAPGEIGCAYNDQSTGYGYVRVKLDSGATSATPTGAPVIGQLAYWKDRSAAIVTNDSRMSDCGSTGFINRVAGVFSCVPTTAPGVNGTDGQPLQYVTDLIIQGLSVPVATTGTPVLGSIATADTTTTTARALTTGAVNTAPPSQTIGVVKSVTVTSGNVPIDVNIGFIV
jgi:hypothetical protein